MPISSNQKALFIERVIKNSSLISGIDKEIYFAGEIVAAQEELPTPPARKKEPNLKLENILNGAKDVSIGAVALPVAVYLSCRDPSRRDKIIMPKYHYFGILSTLTALASLNFALHQMGYSPTNLLIASQSTALVRVAAKLIWDKHIARTDNFILD